jgi:hypothetical protein
MIFVPAVILRGKVHIRSAVRERSDNRYNLGHWRSLQRKVSVFRARQGRNG